MSNAPARSAALMTEPLSSTQVEDDLRRLAGELSRRMGGRKVSVLAVGSLGRAHQEGVSAAAADAADYDVILVPDRLTEVERMLCRRRIRGWLRSGGAGLRAPVSVGILRASAFPRLPFTLFNYEMRYGHRVLAGRDPTNQMPSYRAEQMPLIEATRLLLNRGVLLWGDSLRSGLQRVRGDGGESRAVALRNRKALMAIGDALLIAAGSYHWSYGGRLARAWACPTFRQFGEDLRARYTDALECRMRGMSVIEGRSAGEEAFALLGLHAEVFRFVEEQRLGRSISTWRDYPESALGYPRDLDPSLLKRLVHLIRSFGPPRGSGFYRRHLGRAPEEVLLRGFPCFAYGEEGVSLKHTLNWKPTGSPTPVAVWERFHRAWTRTG